VVVVVEEENKNRRKGRMKDKRPPTPLFLLFFFLSSNGGICTHARLIHSEARFVGQALTTGKPGHHARDATLAVVIFLGGGHWMMMMMMIIMMMMWRRCESCFRDDYCHTEEGEREGSSSESRDTCVGWGKHWGNCVVMRGRGLEPCWVLLWA